MWEPGSQGITSLSSMLELCIWKNRKLQSDSILKRDNKKTPFFLIPAFCLTQTELKAESS